MVYVAPLQDIAQNMYEEWSLKFGKAALGKPTLGKNVCILTGDTNRDLKLLAANHIIVSNPENWDILSRRWKQRTNVRAVNLFIIDELQVIVYKIMVS